MQVLPVVLSALAFSLLFLDCSCFTLVSASESSCRLSALQQL